MASRYNTRPGEYNPWGGNPVVVIYVDHHQGEPRYDSMPLVSSAGRPRHGYLTNGSVGVSNRPLYSHVLALDHGSRTQLVENFQDGRYHGEYDSWRPAGSYSRYNPYSHVERPGTPPAPLPIRHLHNTAGLPWMPANERVQIHLEPTVERIITLYLDELIHQRQARTNAWWESPEAVQDVEDYLRADALEHHSRDNRAFMPNMAHMPHTLPRPQPVEGSIKRLMN